MADHAVRPSGEFYLQWSEGGPSRDRVEIPASECPRTSAESLASERLTLGDGWFAQEYLCSSKEAIGQMFSTEKILDAFRGAGSPLFEGGEFQRS